MAYIYVCHSSSCSSSWERFTENLRSTKNQPLKSLRQVFQLIERLITNQTENTGLTTIEWQHPRARSKCRTITSLSLWTRNFHVQISQDPIRTGKKETIFRKKWILTSTGAVHLILWPCKCCDISSWRKQSSFVCWSEIWTQEARIQSGISPHFHLWTSAANLCSAIRVGRHPSRICGVSKRASSTTRRIGHKRESTSTHLNKKYSRNGTIEESSRTTSRLREKIKRKSRHDTETHITKRVAREGEFCMSDSGEIQNTESNYSGKFSHVPSQPAAFPSPRSLVSRDKRLPLDTWNLSGRETSLAIHAPCSIHHRHFTKEFCTLRLQVLQVRSQRK